MSRPLSKLSTAILKTLDKSSALLLHEIQNIHGQAQYKKTVYDTLFRLEHQGLVEKSNDRYHITLEGRKLIHTFQPTRDSLWKIIIFDIPETKREVRGFLRQKLQALHFKKWQNSIWVSPYILDPELEAELLQLAQKYFVRLIKTKDINYNKDLKKLFPE